MLCLPLDGPKELLCPPPPPPLEYWKQEIHDWWKSAMSQMIQSESDTIC